MSGISSFSGHIFELPESPLNAMETVFNLRILKQRFHEP